jgi:hypothetical protein
MLWTDHTYRVVLFGHRYFEEHRILDEKLYPLLKTLLRTKDYVEIYIGRNGEFDIYAASIVKQVQKTMGKENSELICVLPYSEKDIEYLEKYYDRIIIPERVGRMHPKGAITARNRWMTEQADLFVCYVEREDGGAYTAMKYAKKLGKQILNLAEKEIS